MKSQVEFPNAPSFGVLAGKTPKKVERPAGSHAYSVGKDSEIVCSQTVDPGADTINPLEGLGD